MIWIYTKLKDGGFIRVQKEDREKKYMDTIMEIIKNLDWTPLFISFKTGIVATVISFFLGLFAARKVVHAGERAKPSLMVS